MEDKSYDISTVSAWSQRQWDAFFKDTDPLLRSVCGWNRWRFAPHVIEEVIQAVRARLPASLVTYDQRAPLAHYIKKICMFACIDRVRQDVIQSSRRFEPIDRDDDGPPWIESLPDLQTLDPSLLVIETERSRAVNTALEQLDATCREAIRLFYLEDISYKDMAERLDVAVNTVGSRLAKCRDKLREILTRSPFWRE